MLHAFLCVFLAPTVAPANFELDPEVALTATSAGFRWDHVDTSPEALNGKFQGYKVFHI